MDIIRMMPVGRPSRRRHPASRLSHLSQNAPTIDGPSAAHAGGDIRYEELNHKNGRRHCPAGGHRPLGFIYRLRSARTQHRRWQYHCWTDSRAQGIAHHQHRTNRQTCDWVPGTPFFRLPQRTIARASRAGSRSSAALPLRGPVVDHASRRRHPCVLAAAARAPRKHQAAHWREARPRLY